MRFKVVGFQNSTRIVRWYLHMGSRFERDVIFHVNLEWIPFDHQVALGGGRRDVDKCICHWPTPIVDVWLITPQRSRWFLVNTLALLELPAGRIQPKMRCGRLCGHAAMPPALTTAVTKTTFTLPLLTDIWSMVRVLTCGKNLKLVFDLHCKCLHFNYN